MEKIKIKHYLANSSVVMNARQRNKIETNLLNLLDSFANDSQINLDINVEASSKGSLIENYQIIPDLITLELLENLAIAIGSIIGTIVTGLGIKKYSGELENIRLDRELKKIALQDADVVRYMLMYPNELESDEKLEQILLHIFRNSLDIPKTKKLLSNYYKALLRTEDIEAISVQGFNENDNEITEEIIVHRNEFRENIYEDTSIPPEEFYGINIEIIAPVLNQSKANWKGKLEEKPINFVMNDYKFQFDVFDKKYSFKNGSIMNCDLIIERKLDSYGEIKDSKFIVSNVHDLR